MNLEREFLRKSAGLPLHYGDKKLNEEEKFSKIRTLDVEAELLRVFSNTLREIKRLKEMMDSRFQGYGPMGPGPMRTLRDEKGPIDKERLLKVAMDKLDLIEEALAECFDAKVSSEDEVDHEEDDHDEEDYDYEEEPEDDL
jgi:hypothetical protein